MPTSLELSRSQPYPLRAKFRGALLGALVGDALGAVFEGHPGPVSNSSFTALERSYETLLYTDDTALTMAVAESLLYAGDLDEDHLAATMARRFEREPHRGYGAGTAALLARLSRGEEWKPAASAQFGGEGSFGNGAAMRVAPVALAAAGDPAIAATLSRRSARVTHTHPLGVDAAAVQAVAVALALAHPGADQVDRHHFLDRVAETATEPILREQLSTVAGLLPAATAEMVATRVGTGVEAHEAVPAALCAFLRHPGSYRDTVRFAIALGGDTDTIASMAGAIAGACLGENAIPDRWLQRAEGAEHARDLADRFVRRTLDASGTFLRARPEQP